LGRGRAGEEGKIVHGWTESIMTDVQSADEGMSFVFGREGGSALSIFIGSRACRPSLREERPSRRGVVGGRANDEMFVCVSFFFFGRRGRGRPRRGKTAEDDDEGK